MILNNMKSSIAWITWTQKEKMIDGCWSCQDLLMPFNQGG